jgi:hypothetical protein
LDIAIPGSLRSKVISAGLHRAPVGVRIVLMPVTWEFRGKLLVLSVAGIVENSEIERAFDQALADPRCGPGIRLLWNASRSQTPVSAADVKWRLGLLSSLADRGILARVALLGRVDQRSTIAIGRSAVMEKALAAESAVFTDESDAVVWLEAG